MLSTFSCQAWSMPTVIVSKEPCGDWWKRRILPRDDNFFWSWREMMYAIAGKATPETVETLATWCFLDCLKTGFSHIGEFHYIHHKANGTPYDPSYEIAQRIALAAQKVGIRLTFGIPLIIAALPMLRPYLHKNSLSLPRRTLSWNMLNKHNKQSKDLGLLMVSLCIPFERVRGPG